MQPLTQEPEMEVLLNWLIPGSLNQMEGATIEEIEQIERLAGRPLPQFYRWFLSRMGRNMGPFTNPGIDFSVSIILASYAEELFKPCQRYLMIGYEKNEMMPLHLMYDFDYPSRDDARVVKMDPYGGPSFIRFETLREQLAWGEMFMFRISRFPLQCRGLFVDDDGDVLSKLNPLMQAHGFITPAGVATGPFCGLYEGGKAAMITTSTPGKSPKIHVFRIGANNAGTIRSLLGKVATESSLSVEIDEWSPALP